MSGKVQEALDLVQGLDKDEMDEFLAGMRNVFELKDQQRKAEGPVVATKTTPEAVWEKLTSGLLENEKDRLYYHYREALERGEILRDINTVDFSLENIELDSNSCRGQIKELIGPRMFGNIAGVGCQAGGDWEWPVFFIVYIGVDDQLHAYVPKDGNTYNHDTKSAFGNSDVDYEFMARWVRDNRPDYTGGIINPAEQDGELMFDKDKIVQDITTHIIVA